MKFDFLDRRRAERFAELLDENGSNRHRSPSDVEDELAKLVSIGHSLSAVRTTAHVENDFRTGLRAMLVATAERDGIGDTAEPETAGGGHAAEPRRSLLGLNGRRIRARGAIVIGVAAGAMAVSGISAASENAAPGDALYGVKRSTERAQLAMAGSDVTRGQLSLDFARTRLAEAAALAGGAGGFAGVLNDMDADTRQGVKLLTEAAVARQDVSPLSRIDAFATGQRRVFLPLLDRLTPAEQTRAESSLKLLEQVETRSRQLRAGLDCGTVKRDGADALGPRLESCLTGQDSSEDAGSGKSGHGQRNGSKPGAGTTDTSTGTAQPEKAEPAADPAATTTADSTAPGDTQPKADLPGEPPSSRPGPDSSAPAEPSEEEPGLLSGLLGKLFG